MSQPSQIGQPAPDPGSGDNAPTAATGGPAPARQIPLPPPEIRFTHKAFADDSYFLESCLREADRLIRHAGLHRGSRILDFGCGVGRLAIGILGRLGGVADYCGIDVLDRPLSWCQHHITPQHPSFRFIHSNAFSARYNPDGMPLSHRSHLPLPDRSFDIVCANSVLCHMTSEEASAHLSQFSRCLTTGGRAFITAFLEADVPDETVNPKGYRRAWEGPLQCVRYEREYFLRLARDAGLVVIDFSHGSEPLGQSAVYLEKNVGGPARPL